MTGPVDVIKPLPVPRLGLVGDGFFVCFSPGVTDSFLEGRSSFLLTFLLGDPFPTPLGADEDAISFPFSFSSFLHDVAALTSALYLTASISAKDMATLSKQTWIKKTNNNKCNLHQWE